MTPLAAGAAVPPLPPQQHFAIVLDRTPSMGQRFAARVTGQQAGFGTTSRRNSV